MNIGVTSLTLKKYTIEEVIEIVTKAELDGIEWGEFTGHIPLGDLEIAKKASELTTKANLNIFSFGSYFKLGENIDFTQTLFTAKALNAPIIRIWAGILGSIEAGDDYFNSIVNEAKLISDIASKEKIKLGFEYHQNTLTDCSSSALKLIKAVNHDNCRLYWQPNGNLSFSQNHEELKEITPYLAGNFHIHNYNSVDGYKALCEIKEEISNHFKKFVNPNFNCMIEFVKDHNIDNFYKDAKALKEIFRGEDYV